MVFEEKHHMLWAYEAYEAYEVQELNFRESVVNAFHRCGLLPPPTGRPPPSKREVLGFRRSKPAALPSIGYRGFAVAPITLRAPSRRVVVITSGTNGRAMRAPTGYDGATNCCNDKTQRCKCISPFRFPPRCRGAHRAPADIIQTFNFSPQRPPSSREGDRPVGGGRSKRRRWKQFVPIAFMPNIILFSDACRAYEAQEAYEAYEE